MDIDYNNLYIIPSIRYKYALLLASLIDPYHTQIIKSKIMEEQIELQQLLENVPEQTRHLLVYSLALSEYVRNHVEPMTLTQLIDFIKEYTHEK